MKKNKSLTIENESIISGIKIAHKTIKLDNGLTLIVYENYDMPLVSVNMTYLVGSKDECHGKTGFAHLFEHIMFEGSENAPGSFFTNMTKVGASNINAFTSQDRTTYHFTVPLGSLDYGLFMESDRMGYFLSSINQKSLNQQRSVVLNEKTEKESVPYGKLYETSLKGSYPSQHPYSHTVIGESADIENASLSDAREWFTRWYTPSNAILTLCGSINSDTALEKVKKWFGEIPSGESNSRIKSWVPYIDSHRVDIYYTAVSDTTLSMHWNTPPFGEYESILLSFISDIFTGGINGTLNKSLVYNDPLLNKISSSLNPGVLCSQFIIHATINEGHDIQVVRDRIIEHIDDFINSFSDNDIVNQVRNQSITDFNKSYRTSEKIADLLASSYLFWGHADGYLYYYYTYQTCIISDLKNAANKWLKNNHYELISQPLKKIKKNKSHNNKRSQPLISSPGIRLFPNIKLKDLDNGLTVKVAERHNNSDIFMELLFKSNKKNHMEMNIFLSNIINISGVEGKDNFSFDKELRSSGLVLNFRERLGSVSLTLECNKKDLLKGIELLYQRLYKSELSKHDFIRVKNQKISSLTNDEKNPRVQSLRYLPAIMYPIGHPCRIPKGVEFTKRTLDGLTFSSLNHYVKNIMSISPSTLMVSGDVTMDEIYIPLNNILGNHVIYDNKSESELIIEKIKSPRIYAIDIPGAEQSSIVVGTMLSFDRYLNGACFDLLNDIFSNGFTSRLNMNLRENKNWTYGVNSGIINDRYNRVHYVQTDIQADKTIDAFHELLDEYYNINGIKPVTSDELEQRRTASLLATSSWGESLEAFNNIFTYLERNNLPDDFWLRYQEQLREVNVDDINKMAKDIFCVNSLTWIISGDISSYSKYLSDILPNANVNYLSNGDVLYH